MNKFGAYLGESYKEMMEKVTWPTWEQLQQSTIIVLIATLVITLVVSVMDFFSSELLKGIYKLF